MTNTEYHPPLKKKLELLVRDLLEMRPTQNIPSADIGTSHGISHCVVDWCEETPAVSPPRTPSRLTNLPQFQNGKTRLTQLKNIYIVITAGYLFFV